MKIQRLFLNVCILCILFAWPFSVNGASLRIHFIDVGEGDCILIQTPESKNVLIDAGNFISAYRIKEYLKKQNIENLEYLIFTHPHFDHIGGGFTIFQEFDVKQVCDNGQNISTVKETSDVYRWYDRLIRQDKRYRALQRGDAWYVDRVRFNVFWPGYGRSGGDFNINSLVIMVEYNTFRCLLMADLPATSEKGLLELDDGLSADILKISHHGADNGNSQLFLGKVSPKIAVISVDKNNVRGYPSTDTLDKLNMLKIKTYRTDRDGDIVVYVDSKSKMTVHYQKNNF
ncbi:MAG: MBL fold metallo-hydrolase [Candidatus Omnitrophica bacterium]|nr:MBL fold metallo-hydrolase [Candidatus Omnitrophota bacterium]